MSERGKEGGGWREGGGRGREGEEGGREGGGGGREGGKYTIYTLYMYYSQHYHNKFEVNKYFYLLSAILQLF